MKKILAIMALCVAGGVWADSVQLETQRVDVVGANDQRQYGLQVKHNFASNLAGDVNFTVAQTDGSNNISNRLEVGLTPTFPLVGSISGYTRVGVGQKFTNTAAFGFYSVEPGLTAPVGPFTARLGVRYRSATDSAVNNDQTHTVRAGLSYALTKVDAVGVRYDRMRGDATQNVVALNYTRSF